MKRWTLWCCVQGMFLLLTSNVLAQNFFMANGTGSQEVTVEPTGVASDASCVATFRVLNDETMLSYTLQCFNIIDVTQGHIHLGDIHNNGPVVAIIFGPRDDDNPTGPVNGLLQQGTLTTDDLKEEKTMAEVLQSMRSDGAYLNVHTAANLKGEVRGQIVVIQDTKIVDEFFIAPASGTNQFPVPVATDAKCLASFRVLGDGAKLKYKLKCWNLVGATLAHIHLGKGTEFGPPAALLFSSVIPTDEINGKLSSGVLTDNADVLLIEGMALFDIIDAIRSDNAYLNVHTEDNLLGEVRGQISLVGNLAGGF